ncbi:hypothetical protein V8E51_013907 [Hyaloscypha variabilis]
MVCDLTDVEVHCITGEGIESAAERMRVVQKLQVLEAGMLELKRQKKHNPSTLAIQKVARLQEASADSEGRSETAASGYTEGIGIFAGRRFGVEFLSSSEGWEERQEEFEQL